MPSTRDPENLCLPATGTCECLTEDHSGLVRTCSVANDAGTCYGFETCDPAVGFTGCTASTPAPEECNGLDDDCDGVVDEGMTAGEPCENVVPGVGSCPGTRVCQGPLGFVCVGQAPVPEACNYLDDDCDGETDEDFRVTTGYGGPGGDGGNGGVGGTGGPGAPGGTGGGSYNPPTPTYPSFRGGKGGQGGRGGHGGGGGGGCGGPSYGIFANGVSGAALQAWKADNTFQVSGAGGSGGHGGFSLDEPGGDGLDGSMAATNF